MPFHPGLDRVERPLLFEQLAELADVAKVETGTPQGHETILSFVHRERERLTHAWRVILHQHTTITFPVHPAHTLASSRSRNRQRRASRTCSRVEAAASRAKGRFGCRFGRCDRHPCRFDEILHPFAQDGRPYWHSSPLRRYSRCPSAARRTRRYGPLWRRRRFERRDRPSRAERPWKCASRAKRSWGCARREVRIWITKRAGDV